MRTIRKKGILLIGFLVLLFVGCLSSEPLEPVVAARYTSTWAKVGTRFFFVKGWDAWSALYSVPIDDIASGERVNLPPSVDDANILSIEIVGVGDSHIFVGRRSGEWSLSSSEIFRVCTASLEATFIYESISSVVPRLHLPSNSILFAHSSADGGVMERLCLDTGEMRVFYEFEYIGFDTRAAWLPMEDGYLVLNNGSWGVPEHFFLISPELEVERVNHNRLSFLYVSQPWVDPRRATINGINFAIIPAGIYEDSYYSKAVKLAEDGRIAKIIGSGWDGHNVALSIWHLAGTEMVIVYEGSYFWRDGRVRGIYCMLTGVILPER